MLSFVGDIVAGVISGVVSGVISGFCLWAIMHFLYHRPANNPFELLCGLESSSDHLTFNLEIISQKDNIQLTHPCFVNVRVIKPFLYRGSMSKPCSRKQGFLIIWWSMLDIFTNNQRRLDLKIFEFWNFINGYNTTFLIRDHPENKKPLQKHERRKISFDMSSFVGNVKFNALHIYATDGSWVSSNIQTANDNLCEKTDKAK